MDSDDVIIVVPLFLTTMFVTYMVLFYAIFDRLLKFL